MLVGGHVSIAGGIAKAIENGTRLQASAIQTFASSPRTLKFKPVGDAEVQKYLALKEKSDIDYHLFHGIYLINLAHENPEYVELSINSLVAYQQLAGRIGGVGTVFHVGSHKGRGFDVVRAGIVDALVRILNETPDGVRLFLENAAGQNGVIGGSLKELGELISGVVEMGGAAEKLGICIDTQHAFASGYQIHTADGLDDFVSDVGTNIGMDRVAVLHVNDSLTKCGSNRDRHANLGEGEIGLSGIKRVITRPEFSGLPLILEVPGEEKSGPRQADVDVLRHLLT